MVDLSTVTAWVQAHRLSLLLALAFLLGLVCTLYLTGLARRLLGSRYRKRGLRAEKRALRLLRKKGYRVLEHQPRFRSLLYVDGFLTAFEVTPDFLVERDGRRFVVEIKSAPEHAGIRTAAVRRQVIEYLWAAEMPCLLLTMPAGEIEIISFGDSGSVDAFADDVGQGDQMEGG